MASVKIKICGITSPADARLALESGADFIGLNFYTGPRRIDMDKAAEILAAGGAGVVPVALVDASAGNFFQLIHDLNNRLNIRTFQLYGRLKDGATRSQRPGNRDASLNFWPVVRVASQADLIDLPARFSHPSFMPSAMLLDAFSPEHQGGTGETFNWQWIHNARHSGALAGAPTMVLAGGLTPLNVAQAIHTVAPWAVDVSSGVEIPGQPGKKDADKIRAFIAAARSI
jgi:phosphoribosylanthranilate isomerase